MCQRQDQQFLRLRENLFKSVMCKTQSDHGVSFVSPLRTPYAGTYPPCHRLRVGGRRRQARVNAQTVCGNPIPTRRDAIETIRSRRSFSYALTATRRDRASLEASREVNEPGRRETRSIDGYKSGTIVEEPKFSACFEQRNAIVFVDGRYGRMGKKKKKKKESA